MADRPQNIDKPSSAKQAKGDGVVIHTMPDDFLKKKATAKKKPVSKKPTPPPAKPLPPPKAKQPAKKGKQAPGPGKKKKFGPPLILFIVGVLLLAGLAVGGWFLILSAQPEEPPAQEPVEEAEPEPEPEPEPESEPRRSRDTDSDALTDVEEALYGTDFRNPDTDADSFLDGNEVFHLYDPVNPAPATLAQAGRVEEFTFADNAFTVLYPSAWDVATTAEGAAFRSRTTESFDVARFVKPEEQGIRQWYEQEIAAEDGAQDLSEYESKQGFEGLESRDERVIYLNTGDAVYRFTYLLGRVESIDYPQTFKMFVNSFTKVE